MHHIKTRIKNVLTSNGHLMFPFFSKFFKQKLFKIAIVFFFFAITSQNWLVILLKRRKSLYRCWSISKCCNVNFTWKFPQWKNKKLFKWWPKINFIAHTKTSSMRTSGWKFVSIVHNSVVALIFFNVQVSLKMNSSFVWHVTFLPITSYLLCAHENFQH